MVPVSNAGNVIGAKVCIAGCVGEAEGFLVTRGIEDRVEQGDRLTLGVAVRGSVEDVEIGIRWDRRGLTIVEIPIEGSTTTDVGIRQVKCAEKKGLLRGEPEGGEDEISHLVGLSLAGVSFSGTRPRRQGVTGGQLFAARTAARSVGRLGGSHGMPCQRKISSAPRSAA